MGTYFMFVLRIEVRWEVRTYLRIKKRVVVQQFLKALRSLL